MTDICLQYTKIVNFTKYFIQIQGFINSKPEVWKACSRIVSDISEQENSIDELLNYGDGKFISHLVTVSCLIIYYEIYDIFYYYDIYDIFEMTRFQDLKVLFLFLNLFSKIGVLFIFLYPFTMMIFLKVAKNHYCCLSLELSQFFAPYYRDY